MQAGALAALNSLFPKMLLASGAPQFSDYKALVCVMLEGGNDSMNMFVPAGGGDRTGYELYALMRPTIGVAQNDLSALLQQMENPYAASSTDAAYRKGFYRHSGMALATHAMMPELARHIDRGHAAIVANMGTLVAPATKTELKNGTVPLPDGLFGHALQRRAMHCGIANNLGASGWAGRLFDAWEGVNQYDILGMNISYSGAAHLLSGRSTKPLVLNTRKPNRYWNMAEGSARRDDFLAWHALDAAAHPFRRLYGNMATRAIPLADTLAELWENSYTFSTHDAYGNALFDLPSAGQLDMQDGLNGGLLLQLEAVAKMIHASKQRGIKRQVFFVKQWGYDTHGRQTVDHALALRALSLALEKFQLAMQELGIEDEVTTFSLSDFGRTVGENGDGTDHGWGGNSFAIGGAVQGGLYGTLPDLRSEGPDDFISQGRLIPTTAADQYFATLLEWLGADAALQLQLLPNLANFQSRTLGFL